MYGEEENEMNKFRIIIISLLFISILLIPVTVSAQQVFPAKGSLESSEDGLWNYYKGKTKQTVKRNAPMFEKISENNRYLLDYTKIKGVELYLSADFKDNKLALLQIMTPFPEYKTCNKETKDMSRSFAEVGYALMGVKFDAKKQCTTTKGSASAYLCTAEDYACVYQLCPDKIWALACSVIDPQ